MNNKIFPVSIFLQQMAQAPDLLEELMAQIPVSLHKQRRIPGKWSIHEHACHLADVHEMLIQRFERFQQEERPIFQPFLPGKSVPDGHLLDMDLAKAIAQFRLERSQLLQLLESFSAEDWATQATHPEYKQYSALILARHVVMHDHFHMYRIEELWLTADDYLRN
ncbi:MAG: DinB family protein [Saprospiraceae bacterium]|nr:DinB family protein [Saprospiraceae bacterium]